MAAVLLAVWIPGWELESDRRTVRVGETLSSWLSFDEIDVTSEYAEGVQVVRGVARRLPPWPGQTFQRHPVRIDLEGGALYWDALQAVAGTVELVGTVRTNNVDAPDDFPRTSGVVRRIRMEWGDRVIGSDGGWVADGRPRYDEVAATYFPRGETAPLDPEEKGDLRRRAWAEYEREVALGRHTPGEPFEVGLWRSGRARRPAPGSRRTDWTGVLVDLEIGGGLKV